MDNKLERALDLLDDCIHFLNWDEEYEVSKEMADEIRSFLNECGRQNTN